MKKNEHYFPTMEFAKDEKEPLGWKKIVHEAEKGGTNDLAVEGAMEVESAEGGGPSAEPQGSP